MISSSAYRDIYKELKSLPGFQNQVKAIVSELQVLEGRSPSPKNVARRRQLLVEMYRCCDFNPGMLVPYYFPRYPGSKPLSLLRRPFAFALYHWMMGGYTAIRGSRQISKSTSFGGRQLINAQNIPRWGSMYVCPHTDHRSTYATRLREMEMAFRFYKKRHDLRQNLFLKEFPNGSKIELVRALTSAAHIRGKSTDEVLYDEYQLFDIDLEAEIDQTMKASEARVRIYAGTSTTIDSPLEDRYRAASQGCWHVKGARGWINFGDEKILEKMITADGLRDPWTGGFVDVTEGEWVHAERDRLKMNLVSFHIPQLIIPDFIYDYQQWSDIYRAFHEYDRPLFLQEVLGIPVEEGSREITEKDLERICVLGTIEDCLRRVKSGDYKFVVSGFDWGGSDHRMATNIKTSYTVHVLLGITYLGEMHILKMKRYAGMAYRRIVSLILADHFAYNGTAVASDSGGGQVYNQIVREDSRLNRDRHLVLHYSGPNTAIMTAPNFPDAMYNEWMINKTESLTTLFEMIKDPSMPLKCYSWAQSRDYLSDFLNSFRVVTEKIGGARYFQYIRAPSKSDDCMHACNFAKITGQVLLGQPIVVDPSMARDLAQRLRVRVGAGHVHAKSRNPYAGGSHVSG